MAQTKRQKAIERIEKLNAQESLILCELANTRENIREEINRLNLNQEEKDQWKKRRNSRTLKKTPQASPNAGSL